MSKKLQILHIGIHGNIIKNVGDKVHFFLLRKWFDQNFKNKIQWELQQIWKKIDNKSVNRINKKYDLLIIGGGGLFLRDQKGAAKTPSGWQFNISNQNLEKIKVPIIVFGVGFNKFRGQKNFDERFKRSVRILHKKSLFFGLRNQGSIKNIKKITKLNKFALQPCVTTLINKIIFCQKVKQRNLNEISFGFAADRLNLRFKNDEKIKYFIKSIILSLKYFKKYKINYIMHKPNDDYFLKYFDKEIIKKINVVNLSDASIKNVIKFYKSQKIVFSMRGHNQLISYGCRRPFFSFITHDKIKFFCDDQNLLKYSADIEKDNFRKKFLDFCKNFKNNNTLLENKIKFKNSKLFIKSKKNIEFIKKTIQIN